MEAWTVDLAALPVGERSSDGLTTVLLPSVTDRLELGLLPPDLFGPTLFALRDQLVVVGARLRRRPLTTGIAASEVAVPIALAP